MDSVLALSDLHHQLMELIMTLALCSLRIRIAFMILPATDDHVLQGVNRNAVAMLLGFFVAYGQPITLHSMSPWMLVLIVGKEALLGLMMGFAASTVFWVAQNVGILIDDLAGFNNVQISNPQRQDTSTPTSELLGHLVIIAFWVLGGMTFLLGAIYQSFQWWPLQSIAPVPQQILESFVLQQTDTLMQMTAKVATPMLLILVLIDLAFGFLAKGFDKLETAELSMPVKGAMTLLILAVFINIFIDQVKDQLALGNIAAQFHAMVNGAKPKP